MASFGQQRQHADSTGKEAQDRVDRAAAVPDPLVSHLIALQQSAGNAAVSRLVARSRMLHRQHDGGAPAGAATPPAAPAAPAPAAPANQNDALLAMTRTAWETGVIQRERDAGAALRRPHAGKPALEQADNQLQEAHAATMSIGNQLGTLDPNRVTRARVHANGINAIRFELKPMMERVTPADVANDIDVAVIPSSERTIADLAAPLSAPGAAGGAQPAAPAPAGP